MNLSSFESSLPRFDRTLLRLVQTVVPHEDREDWSRTWHSELWYMHHRCTRKPHSSRSSSKSSWQRLRFHADLSIGLTFDALWLRTEDLRRTYSGTPLLCLLSLSLLCALSLLLSLSLNDSWRLMTRHLAAAYKACLIATPLVVFVAYFTAAPSRIAPDAAGNILSRFLYRILGQLFLLAKGVLLLALAFLLSTSLLHPMRPVLPNTAYLLQILWFNLSALMGLRWAFLDQEQRCKQCLRLLSTPARVGRPSCNLLEWTGTEQECSQGHGRLHTPEMASSWAQTSSWTAPRGGWDEIASA